MISTLESVPGTSMVVNRTVASLTEVTATTRTLAGMSASKATWLRADVILASILDHESQHNRKKMGVYEACISFKLIELFLTFRLM